jgi:hypothetical protein
MRPSFGSLVSDPTFLNSLATNKDTVKEMKLKAFRNPKKYLYPESVKKYPQIRQIFEYMQQVGYYDEPRYGFIK